MLTSHIHADVRPDVRPDARTKPRSRSWSISSSATASKKAISTKGYSTSSSMTVRVQSARTSAPLQPLRTHLCTTSASTHAPLHHFSLYEQNNNLMEYILSIHIVRYIFSYIFSANMEPSKSLDALTASSTPWLQLSKC